MLKQVEWHGFIDVVSVLDTGNGREYNLGVMCPAAHIQIVVVHGLSNITGWVFNCESILNATVSTFLVVGGIKLLLRWLLEVKWHSCILVGQTRLLLIFLVSLFVVTVWKYVLIVEDELTDWVLKRSVWITDSCHLISILHNVSWCVTLSGCLESWNLLLHSGDWILVVSRTLVILGFHWEVNHSTANLNSFVVIGQQWGTLLNKH